MQFHLWIKIILLHAAILLTAGALASRPEIPEIGSESDIETLVTKPRLVLVIDDIGYNQALGKRAAELPGAITYAVIPHTPLARKLAFYALNNDPAKEIIVHMPMQSALNKSLGEGALTDDLEQSQFLLRIREAIADVPFARGLSNHMGSHLTGLPVHMQWLMGELRRQDYFYLDSRTSASTRPEQAAAKEDVAYLKRDIFLDHDPSPSAIALAFERAVQLARKQGHAVLLAHPYPSTLTYLENVLPGLAEKNIVLATASTLLDEGNSDRILSTGSR